MHLLPATCFRAVERDKFHLPANSIGSVEGLVSGPRDERPGNTFCEKLLLASSCLSLHLSVHMEELGSLWTDYSKIPRLSIFFKNLSRNFKFNYNLTRTTGTLHEDLYTIMISRSTLLTTKSRRENQYTYGMFNNNFFFCENLAVYEMWQNAEQLERPQMIWCMSTACLISRLQ